MSTDMESRVTQLLRDAESKKLWGTIEFEFRNGSLVVIRKSETTLTTENNHVQQQKR